MKDGYNMYCIVCHKADNVARKAINRSIPEFKAKEQVLKKQYRERTMEQHAVYMKEWHEKNKKACKIYRKKYNLENKEFFKEYRQKNKAVINARTRKRQAAKLLRTPAWLTETHIERMENQYKLAVLLTKVTGSPWEVDHIIPLQGEKVSGLHVPANLQVIPRAENRSKHNQFEA
jgi:5-methylcytosine-specific restriction endonuclease McrA